MLRTTVADTSIMDAAPKFKSKIFRPKRSKYSKARGEDHKKLLVLNRQHYVMGWKGNDDIGMGVGNFGRNNTLFTYLLIHNNLLRIPPM
jgi:hypothetical protein